MTKKKMKSLFDKCMILPSLQMDDFDITGLFDYLDEASRGGGQINEDWFWTNECPRNCEETATFLYSVKENGRPLYHVINTGEKEGEFIVTIITSQRKVVTMHHEVLNEEHCGFYTSGTSAQFDDFRELLFCGLQHSILQLFLEKFKEIDAQDD